MFFNMGPFRRRLLDGLLCKDDKTNRIGAREEFLEYSGPALASAGSPGKPLMSRCRLVSAKWV